jgi:two-component system, sensor histidine kinase and response regulator
MMSNPISIEFLLSVIDTMPGQVVVRDADSVIIFANRGFAETYGKTADQVLGLRDADLWSAMGRPAEQISLWLAEDREVLASGEGIEYIQEIVRANGEHAYFHNYKVALTLPGGKRYLLAQYADITERRRQELELAQEEALNAELAGIRKLAATYAHEINNPLAGIIGLAQLLREHGGSPEEQREMLLQQEAMARRIAGVTEKLQALISTRTRDYLGRPELLDLHLTPAAGEPAADGARQQPAPRPAG